MVENIDKEQILSEITESIKNLESISSKIDKILSNLENSNVDEKISKLLTYIRYFEKKIIEINGFLNYMQNYNIYIGNNLHEWYVKKIDWYSDNYKNKILFMKRTFLDLFIKKHWEIINSIKNIFSLNDDLYLKMYNINSYELIKFLNDNNIELIPDNDETDKKDEKNKTSFTYLVTSENLDPSLIIKSTEKIKEFWWLKTNNHWFISVWLLWIDWWNRRADAIKQLLIDPSTWKILVISILRDMKVKKVKWTWKLSELANENAYKQAIEEVTWQDVSYISRFNMLEIVDVFNKSFKKIFPNWITLSMLTNKYVLQWKTYDKYTVIYDLQELLELIRIRHNWYIVNSSWSHTKIDLLWDVQRSKRQGEIFASIFKSYISTSILENTFNWISELPTNFLKEWDTNVWYMTLISFIMEYNSKFWHNPSIISIEPRIHSSDKWKIRLNINELRANIKDFFHGNG